MQMVANKHEFGLFLGRDIMHLSRQLSNCQCEALCLFARYAIGQRSAIPTKAEGYGSIIDLKAAIEDNYAAKHKAAQAFGVTVRHEQADLVDI